MHPARRRLTVISAAAVTAIAVVLAVVLGAVPASVPTASAAGTRVGASHPQTILAVGPSRQVLPVQGRCEGLPQPRNVAGLCVAAEAANTGFDIVGGGSATRAIDYTPNAADPNWGLTPTHLLKHLFGSGKFSLSQIDPGGNPDLWVSYMQDLAGRPVTATLKGGVEDIIGTFPRTGGPGTFQFGIRIAPNGSGGYDLITLLTKQ